MQNKCTFGKMQPLDALVCGIIIFSPFANLSLQDGPLGILGAAAGLPFASLIFLAMIFRVVGRRKIKKTMALAFLYFIFVGFVYSTKINGEVNSESSYIKGVKFLIVYCLAVSVMFVRINNFGAIRWSCWIALVISAVSLFSPLSEITFLNYAGSNEGRPRGLTMESSHFALITGSIAVIAFHLERFMMLKSAAALFGLLLILYSQSKAGVLIYCISFFVYYANGMLKKKDWSKNFLVSFCILLAFVLIVMPFFVGRIQNDMDLYTSTATRTTGFVSAIQIFLKNPLGVGFLGYFEYYLKEIPEAVSTVRNYLPDMNFTEIIEYTFRQDTKSVGTKSFFADSVILFGFLFIVVYAKLFFSHYSKARLPGQGTLIPGVVFVFSSLIFWTSGVGFYITFLVLAFSSEKNTIRS